jgi:hypothetical protein
MATTTPNFGWAVPTSTDLVKDGAVAIETLGDSIDASLVDLKGGTTGQVLAKASGTDMDFSWVAIDPLVILDAKGDLITATAADTPARLAVGTNGQYLQADSTASTGLKWATVSSSPTFVGCSLKFGANQTLSNGTNLLVAFDQEHFDTNGFHDNATNNSRITIPASYGGKYLITANISTSAWNNDSRVSIFKNGNPIAVSFLRWNAPDLTSANVYFIADLAVSDYLQINMFQSSGSSQTVKGQNDLGAGSSFFQVQFLGA